MGDEAVRMSEGLKECGWHHMMHTPHITTHPLTHPLTHLPTHSPTHSQELLKYTSDDHPDYPHVVAAQQAMKEVAMLINEQKRRMENIGKIGRWQETIENWKVRWK